MRVRKGVSTPTWLIWEGDDFPRQIHSDSIVFYLGEHIYFDSDEEYKTSLARQLQVEGVSETLGQAYKMIDSGHLTRAGYYYEDEDARYPVYCDNDDPSIDYDATFVEVPSVL